MAESFSPMACSANSSECPPSGASAVCNNGKNYQCSCACPFSACTCSYDSCHDHRINQQLCQLECDICYIVSYVLEFQDKHRRSWNATLSYFFGFNYNDADHFKAEHPINSNIVAYYKPSNPRVVLLNIDFHARNWGILVIFALPLFIAVIVLTQYALADILKKCAPAMMHIDTELNIALWIGIVWPFIILLPILVKGYVKPSGKTALKVLIPLIAALGWLPLVFYRLQHLEWSKIGSSVLAFTFLLLPLGGLLPCMLVFVHSSTTSMSIGIVIGGLLLVLAVFLTVSWRQILTFRVYWLS